MGSPRTTFLKRQREQNRNDKARAKQQRLAARRALARDARTSSPSVDVPTDTAASPDSPPARPADGVAKADAAGPVPVPRPTK